MKIEIELTMMDAVRAHDALMRAQANEPLRNYEESLLRFMAMMVEKAIHAQENNSDKP